MRKRSFGRYRTLGAQNKNCLALSASVQALSDHENVVLTVLEEDGNVADDKYGHLGPVWPGALKEGLNGDIHKT